MTAAAKNHHHHHNHPPSSSAKPPKTPIPTTAPQNPNNPSTTASGNTDSLPITPSIQDQYLSGATHLTRQELLKRRSHNLKQLSRCYRDHYWALMEELKIQNREYYWKYGVSPIKDNHPLYSQDPSGGVERENGGDREGGGNCNSMEVIGENNSNGDLKGNVRCLFVGCKFKAMALTSFCHLHILSDSKQKLYKPCGYIIKSAQAGPITCGKPILSSAVPPQCSVHFQKAQKHVSRALKKAGLNVSSSSKLAPKLHVILAEYVRQIQSKRRAAEKGNKSKVLSKGMSGS